MRNIFQEMIDCVVLFPEAYKHTETQTSISQFHKACYITTPMLNHYDTAVARQGSIIGTKGDQ